MGKLKEFKVQELEQRLEMKKWITTPDNDPCGLQWGPCEEEMY